MKKLLFYCQHILGMGHLVRSMEIVRGLSKDFQVCFINGGEVIPEFEIPTGVEIVNLPALKSDPEFQELQPVDATLTLAEVQAMRQEKLLNSLAFQPDVFVVELFPFGRRQFTFELLPMLEKIKSGNYPTKVVCSLRDILVQKKNQAKHEEKVCQLMNQYFDLLLIHGDRQFQPLEETFSRVSDLKCPHHYTGYVVQPMPPTSALTDAEELRNCEQPLIVTSVGSGRFGHDLLECVIQTAEILSSQLPHQFFIFTGAFMPEDKFLSLQELAAPSSNIKLRRYTPHLLSYLEKADLSINMGGYNTTMNILTTGVRSLLFPFTGNGDKEQTIRAEKLEKLGVLDIIRSDDLQPERLAPKIRLALEKSPTPIQLDLHGVEKTADLLKTLVQQQMAAVGLS